MTLIVKTVTRITLGFIFLYGVYIGLVGHISPGGGFAGGVIIALSFVHIMLAFGKEVALKRFEPHVVRFLVCFGALGFLYIVLVSFYGKCVPLNIFFGQNESCPVYNSKVAIPICEMMIVGAGLFSIFTALVLLSKKDKNAE